MTSIQGRLQIKLEPLDKWSIREQLCLASAVAKNGDQNWMSVSRALKPLGDSNRPPDWFHQQNCAAQYGLLLENVETPKQISDSESTFETPTETILRKLTRERIAELEENLIEEKTEYLKLQEDMTLLQSGNVSEEQLDKWCKEIDEEEKQKEEEAIAHSQWLKEREQRKQEIERDWRSLGKPALRVSQKRKAPESLDLLMELEMNEDNPHLQPQDIEKSALSPLLTSLLKSPSQAQNLANSSILNFAITSQRAANSGFEVITSDMLEEVVDALPNITVKDLESSILSSNDPLPEIKNKDFEVIISDLIQNADKVSDPEQHLQLDDNEDIITNLDNRLQELYNEEAVKAINQAEKSMGKSPHKIDPFEFEEDPEICQLAKPSGSYSKFQDLPEKQDMIDTMIGHDVLAKKDYVDDSKFKEKPLIQPGSVEIVEVVVIEEAEIDKQLNKTQIQDIIHSIKAEVESASKVIPDYEANSKPKEHEKPEKIDSPDANVFDDSNNSVDLEVKSVDDEEKNVDTNQTSCADTFTQEYTGSFFHDLNMKVNKLDKSGKAKRDYSRTKKRESEKDFDILLAVEKAVNAQLEASELTEDNLSDDKDYQEGKKEFDTLSLKPKVKFCPITSDMLEEAVDALPNTKVEDLNSSIFSSDKPLPEIKNEEVEVISDLIQNADMVFDPEQHLQLDDNEDIITNLDNELQELCNEEEETAKAKNQAEKSVAKSPPKIDPFEFEEDPEYCQLAKPSGSHSKFQDLPEKQDMIDTMIGHDVLAKKDYVDDSKFKEKPGIQPGSVEIVEVAVMEEAEIDKQLNKTQIQDIIHSIKAVVESSSKVIPDYEANSKPKEQEKPAKIESPDANVFDDSNNYIDLEVKSVDDKEKNIDTKETSRADIFTPEYRGSFFDDLKVEVDKLDKSGEAKRDYSRTKKRESEKDFEFLLAELEDWSMSELWDEEEEEELPEDNLSDDKDYQEGEKKFDTLSLNPKVKTDMDCSSSPWTEEEDMTGMWNKGRYSTPATPIDSVPNSPASSSAYFDDDPDNRNWKKSVMLVYNCLSKHKYSSLFLKPITDDQSPGYHSIVYKSVDLQTIRKHIEDGVIRTTLEFQRDVLLMFTNAIMYNKTNNPVYNVAKQMQQESIPQMQILLQASQRDVPQRCETRTSEPNKRKRPLEDNMRVKKRKED